MMQSSRRKRERGENEQQGAGPRRHKKKIESVESTEFRAELGAAAAKNDGAAAEVSPQVEDPMITSTAGQATPPMQVTTKPTEGTNGGIGHSELATTGTTAMDTSYDANDATMTRQESASWQGTGKGTREERISALISHRKILLERMKQCKVAADSRIKRNSEKQKQPAPADGTKAAGDAASGDTEKQDKGQANSDKEEIEKYRETCRKAVEANRKQNATADKRPSVTLRRGSSVGKRMTAGQTSQVSSGGASSLPPGDATAALHASGIGSGSESLASVSSASIQLPMPNSKQAALKAAQQRVQPVKAPLPPTTQNYGSQNAQRKRSSSTASNRASKSYSGSSSAPPSQGPPSLPLHAGTGASGLPFNRLAYPTVRFPEARALREKRDGIRAKLNALIHERLERIQQTSDANKAGSAKTAELKSFDSLTEKPSVEEYRLALPRMVLERGVNSPTKLPRRRKTHWDYLLEEMRWLATDFVEERKWKTASARTLGSAVVSNRLNAVAPIEKNSSDDGKVDEVESAEEKKESASEDMDVEMSAEELPEEMGARKYAHPGSSDTRLTQSAALIICDMIAEVWTGTTDCGLLANTDEPLMSALSRHGKLRKETENRNESMTAKDKATSLQASPEEDKENGSAATNAEEMENSTAVDENGQGNENGDVNLPLLSNDEISELIDELAVRVKDRTVRRNRSKPAKEPVSLGAGQRKAVELVEFMWGGLAHDTNAPCLDGPVVTGKTVLSCSLLWKRRCEGPQLLVCSPSRLLRWAYELGRFTDLNLHVFGMRCGLSSAVSAAKAYSKFDSGDVVLCEFSSLVDLEEETQETKLNLSAFATVMTDVRFPTEKETDLPRSKDSNVSRKARRTSSGEFLMPPELVSHHWWATFLRSLQPSKAKRLLIDNFECRFLSEDDGLEDSGLSERQRMDTLAAMAAFVVGPNLFHCPEARSVQHKVVSWAKHCAKEGDARKRPSYGEVRGVIVDAASSFRIVMDSDDGASKDEWDTRLCPLSLSQRTAYEECCLGVRGALAFGSITDYAEDNQHPPETYHHAVQGLMKLRRVCVHSQIEGFSEWCVSPMGFVRQPLKNSFDSARFISKVGSSASQPQADLANRILSESAKLRELLTILKEDCGFRLADDTVFAQAGLGPEKKTRKKANKKKPARRKKVAILAMLPEVQLLTSMLLSAVGIHHELLDSAMAWLDSQLALLRFSSTPPEGGDYGSTDRAFTNRRAACEIVIASPVLVGADNGGLGIEAADLVICLDEDWSGRDSALLERISRKCSFAHAMQKADTSKKKDGDCTFVRLVCEKTCEQVFLSDLPEQHTFSDQDWPVDGRGLLMLPPKPEAFHISVVNTHRQPNEGDVGGHFRFPASNVLRFRGKVMSSVLLPLHHIPPAFATGDPVRFLPFQEWEESSSGKKNLSIEFVRSLISEEDQSSQVSLSSDYPRERDISIHSDEPIGCVPPFPSDFPSALMTRHDMMAAASRLYVDRYGKRFILMGGSSSHTDSTARLAGPPVTNSSMTGDHGHLAETGMSSKPGDLVPSLLSYTAADTLLPTKERVSNGGGESVKQVPDHGKANGASLKDQTRPGVQAKDKQAPKSDAPLQSISTTPRMNAFSASYCSSREVVSNVVRDGNQGFEPLAYFPPLFPSLLAASERAQADAAHQQSFKGATMSSLELSCMPNVLAENDSGYRKRKEPAAVAYPMTIASKRPRLGMVPSVGKAAQPSSSLPPQLSGTAVPQTSSGACLPGTQSSERGLRLMDASIVTEDEGSQWDQSSSLFDMGEDYGLLGVGALSSDIDSEREASMTSVDALGYSKWRDPYEPNGLDHAIFSSTIPCDAEEVEAFVRGETDDSFLETMLLFVAKRSPSGFSGMSTSSAASLGGMSFPGVNSAWSQSSTIPGPSPAAALAGPDTTGAGKKGKRKSQSQTGMPVGAFARVNPTDLSSRSINPYAGASALHSSKGRESYRSKILASILARQGGGRASLFQVPSFLLASIRIRDDVLRRVLRQSQGPSLGRHASNPVGRSWIRACYKLKSSSTKQTGDSALQVSKNQRIKMTTAPAPVDFGPFVAGFISSASAACGALPRGAATGISLPMGVKIPRRSGEEHRKDWAEVEDKKLKESVLRYGLNWHLVAAAVNNVDNEKRMKGKPEDDVPLSRPQSRSPGQCHERWNRLVQLDPDLLGSLRGVERSRHKKAVSRPTSNDRSCVSARRLLVRQSSSGTVSASVIDASLSFVLPSNLFIEKDGDEVMSQEKEKPVTVQVRGKRSFAGLRGAAKKKVEVSLPIPGSVNGEKPSLVAAHPSHAQAVQAAIAGTSGGKPEMWPIEILNLADKHRAAARNKAGSTASSSAAAAAAAGTSRQSSVPFAPQVRSPGRQPSPNNRQSRPHASFQVPHAAMASPSSRNPQSNMGHRQGYPAVSSNGAPGPLARGPPSSTGKPRPPK